MIYGRIYGQDYADTVEKERKRKKRIQIMEEFSGMASPAPGQVLLVKESFSGYQLKSAPQKVNSRCAKAQSLYNERVWIKTIFVGVMVVTFGSTISSVSIM